MPPSILRQVFAKPDADDSSSSSPKRPDALMRSVYAASWRIAST